MIKQPKGELIGTRLMMPVIPKLLAVSKEPKLGEVKQVPIRKQV